MLLLVVEAIAYIADSRTGFRTTFVEALDTIEFEKQPLPRQPEDASGAIIIRDPNEPPDEPAIAYRVGGELIPDATATVDTLIIDPSKIRTSAGRRVFIVGGSAAFGFPYRYTDTFASKLDQRFDDQALEVINAAQCSRASGGLVHLVESIVHAHQPDAIILFSGNNEWIRWWPVAQYWTDHHNLTLQRTLATSRALAWLQFQAFLQSASIEINERDLTGTDYDIENSMEVASRGKFDPQQWEATKEEFLQNFSDNLTAMVACAKKGKVAVILMTIPFKYRLAPDWKYPQPLWSVPETKQDVLSWFQQAADAYEAENFDQSIELLDQALALDDKSPVLHYLRAECLRAQGQHRAAESAYAMCREHVVGNLGSVLSINQCIRTIATEQEVGLLDVVQLFDQYQLDQGGHYNDALIHDDCHPTPLGHEIIADQLGKMLPAVITGLRPAAGLNRSEEN